MSDWIRATRNKHCPICDKPDYCGWTADGAVVHCMRISEGSFKEDSSGGWMHRLKETPKNYRLPPKQPKPVKDMSDRMRLYQNSVANMVLSSLTGELGVSELSLRELGIGWDGEGYCFPMHDSYRNIIGIARRIKDYKFCQVGSTPGIFWPKRVSAKAKTRLFICEGYTDTAALWDIGLDPIGRQGCMGCIGYIKGFLQQGRREIIIVADKDTAKQTGVKYPGITGARKLAEQIKDLTSATCIIQPPKHKDARLWVRSGATAETIDLVIRNTTYEKLV